MSSRSYIHRAESLSLNRSSAGHVSQQRPLGGGAFDESLIDEQEAKENGKNDVHVNVNETSETILHNGLIFTVAIALFADFFLLSVVIPIIPDFFKDEYDSRYIGILFASKPITQFLGNFFSGYLINSQGPRVMLFLSTLVLTVSTAAFGYPFLYLTDHLHEAYIFLMVARSIQGLASSCIMSAGMAIIAQTHVESIHGTAMGMAMAGVAAGALLGPISGSVLSTYFNNATPFFVVSGILVIDMLAQAYTLCECCNSSFAQYAQEKADTLGKDVQETPISMCGLLLDSRVLVLELGNFMGVFTIGMMEVLIPLFLSTQYGYSPLKQGLIFSIMSLSYLIATPISGILSDKLPKWTIFGGGAVLVSFALVMFYGSDHLWLCIMALILAGGGVAAVDTVALSILSAVASQKGYAFGSIYALHDCSTSVGFAAGPLIATAVVELFGGMPKGFGTTAVVCAVVMFLYSFTTLHLSDISASDENQRLLDDREVSKELTTTDRNDMLDDRNYMDEDGGVAVHGSDSYQAPTPFSLGRSTSVGTPNIFMDRSADAAIDNHIGIIDHNSMKNDVD